MTPNVYVPYGLGELGLVSMATPAMVLEDPTSAGVVEPGVQLELVEGGEVRVKLPFQPQGYYGPDAGDRTRFRGDVVLSRRPRPHVTRRQAALHRRPRGPHHQRGRTQGLARIRRVDPHGVSRRARGGRLGVGAQAVETRIAVAIVPSGPLDWKALWAFALERMNVSAPVRYIEVTSLPRNSMGKLERDGLRKPGCRARSCAWARRPGG